MKRVNTVIFDLDDTLHDDTLTFREAAYRAALGTAPTHGVEPRPLGATYVEVAQSYWQNLTNERLAALPANPRKIMWAAALAQHGVQDDDLAVACADEFHRHRNELTQPYPGAVVLLRALRERGIKIGMITNGFAITHREKIAVLGIEQYFDAILLSDEVGMVKPDPRIFLRACELLDSEPAETAMVGDRYDRDVTGAQEVGMFTVLVNYHRITIEPGMRPPDAIVDTIDEVAGVLPLVEPQERRPAEANGAV